MLALARFSFAPIVLLYQSIVLAMSQIWANKIRGVLTTLGILIGVAAVSAVIALIDGMKDRVLGEFEAFGTDKVFVNPQWRKIDRQHNAWRSVVFKNSDFDQLLDRCPSLKEFTRDAGYGNIPVTYHAQTEEERISFHSIDPDWHSIFRRGVTAGRPLTEFDSQQSRRVCVINSRLRDKLNLTRDPTGEVIDVYYFGRLTVVGMLEQPVTMEGSDSETCEVAVPFTFSTHAYAWPTWYSVIATAKSRELVSEAKAEVEFYLRSKRHLKPGEEPNFRVGTAERAIDEINEMTKIVTTIAVGIVGISLLVGGVGIMNIMLVSVSERTREIGLRKAVGARPSAILLQFLIEAVVLCLLGGALGLGSGQAITSAISWFLPVDPTTWDSSKGPQAAHLNFLLPPLAILLAFGFSAGVGLIFGMFPAIKAARLDPIEALRHE